MQMQITIICYAQKPKMEHMKLNWNIQGGWWVNSKTFYGGDMDIFSKNTCRINKSTSYSSDTSTHHLQHRLQCKQDKDLSTQKRE